MQRRAFRLTVAIATAALLMPAAAAADRADTDISISSKVPAFHGRVRSADDNCRSNRSVVLYRKVVGSDLKRIGRTRTSSSGRWAIPVKELGSGAYLAKVKGTRSCRSARTKPLVVD